LSVLPSKNSSSGSERIQKVRQSLQDSFVGRFVQNYRGIINATGRSVKQAPSDLTVPEDVQKDFSASATICEEGEEEDCFYLLLEGTLSIHKKGQRVATIDEPGSIFGEMSALLSGQRTATIVTETSSRVAIFPYEKLRSLFEESPSLARTILKTFLKRLQRAVRLNENLSEFMDRLRQIREREGLPDDTLNLIENCMKITRSEADGDELLNQAREIEDMLENGLNFEREI
jgi:CRP-like cAMP-binding protein